MTVVKVVEDVAFGAHWPCQSMGRGLCAKSPGGRLTTSLSRASRGLLGCKAWNGMKLLTSYS